LAAGVTLETSQVGLGVGVEPLGSGNFFFILFGLFLPQKTLNVNWPKTFWSMDNWPTKILFKQLTFNKLQYHSCVD